MNIDQYIIEEQDPKTVEKTLTKLQDMLASGEIITYIAVQKKLGVTLLPDCIVLSNKRIFLCEAAKLGLTTNFDIFTWAQVKEVAFKEELIGSKFTVVPANGENLTIDYLPKIQVRKLYQLATEALEKQRELERQQEIELKKVSITPIQVPHEPAEPSFKADRPLSPEEEPQLKTPELPEKTPEDELTQKLKKLKSLFEQELISQGEYEAKKNELLSQF
ncbi:Short C-terminal domain-containing protein [bacterium A37T11]|nr:Short C-terminal domain-containing protein [bacterium A37T11]